MCSCSVHCLFFWELLTMLWSSVPYGPCYSLLLAIWTFIIHYQILPTLVELMVYFTTVTLRPDPDFWALLLSFFYSFFFTLFKRKTSDAWLSRNIVKGSSCLLDNISISFSMLHCKDNFWFSKFRLDFTRYRIEHLS